MIPVARAVLACALVLLAGCGDDDEPAGGAGLADLEVVVDRDGPRGSEAPQSARFRCEEAADSPACRAAARLRPGDFAPARERVACTLQYGGPDTARVTGTLRGERIDARFALTNGCEISRWERVADLLAAAAP